MSVKGLRSLFELVDRKRRAARPSAWCNTSACPVNGKRHPVQISSGGDAFDDAGGVAAKLFEVEALDGAVLDHDAAADREGS